MQKGDKKQKEKKNNIPESLLNAADIVHVPVLLGDILLSDRNAGPRNTKLSDAVDIILIEVDLLCTEVALRPLRKTPLLHDLLGLVERDELASDIAVEDSELAADLGALELAWHAARECRDALCVREGGEQFAGGGAELIRGSHGGCVDGDVAGLGGGGLLRGWGIGGLGMGVDVGLGEAAGGVDAGGVLEVLAVLGDQGGSETDQGLAQFGNELCAHQVLYGLLGVGFGV